MELPAHTEDRFLGGAVAALQPEKGHRSGLDAVLLAATVADGTSGKLGDFGAGCGVAGFCAARRCPDLEVTLCEIDPSILALAEAGIGLSHNSDFATRLEAIVIDLNGDRRNREAAGLKDGSFDRVIANPPYNDASFRSSPDSGKAKAHVMDNDLLENWVRNAAALLKAGGDCTFIIRPANLAEALAAFEGRFGSMIIKPVHPRAEVPAKRLLISALKGRRTPLQIAPALVLHEANGEYTIRAQRLLRGQEWLPLR